MYGEGITGRGRFRHIEGSGDLVQLWYPNLASGAVGFSGTTPQGDWVWLDWLSFYVNRTPVAGMQHWCQLALATEIPTTESELNAAEQIFPYSLCRSDSRSAIPVGGGEPGAVLSIGRALATRGRRIVGGFWNVSAAAGEFSVRMGIHDVSVVVKKTEFPNSAAGVLEGLRAAAEESGGFRR